MFWILIGFLIITYLFAKSANDNIEKQKANEGIREAAIFEYCGGNDKIIQDCRVMLFWFERYDYLLVKYDKMRDPFEDVIPYENIIKVSAKTESQVRQDVTLTRLAIFGIFALGMKKEQKTNKYFLVIKYLGEDGEEQNLILGGADQSQLNAYNKIIKEYREKAAKKDSYTEDNLIETNINN